MNQKQYSINRTSLSTRVVVFVLIIVFTIIQLAQTFHHHNVLVTDKSYHHISKSLNCEICSFISDSQSKQLVLTEITDFTSVNILLCILNTAVDLCFSSNFISVWNNKGPPALV